jgi:A/G-specific adenine glycosylase
MILIQKVYVRQSDQQLGCSLPPLGKPLVPPVVPLLWMIGKNCSRPTPNCPGCRAPKARHGVFHSGLDQKTSNLPRLETRKIKRVVPALLKWYAAHARDLPWRHTNNPYCVFISEIMLQQTQVKTVIPYYERWMQALPTLGDLARARPERVLKLWEGLGYYRRARMAQEAARLIIEKHAGRFPETLDEILALPGVGRYTAGAICSIAFDQPAPILDGNVIRVLTRLLGLAGDPRSKTLKTKLWRAAQELVSAGGDPSRLNQGLMELGALICLPRQPDCPACPLRRDCFAWRRKRVEEFPTPATRVAVTQRRFIALVVSDGPRLLVRQRPSGVVNAGLWEFPNVEVALNAKELAPLVAPFQIAARAPFVRVRHTITRYRILLEAYRAKLPAKSATAKAGAAWKTPADIKKLPFTSAHRKVLRGANVVP